MESEIEAVFSSNSKQLKKLFECLHPLEGRISIQEFLVFCKNVRIHPELISLNEIKKTIAQLNLKLGVTFGNMQLLLRLLADQAFNTTSSTPDKLRMLIIHIRSPCKLFYQISLNFNKADSSSDELEVDDLEFEKIKNLGAKKDVVNENSQKTFKPRFLSASPDSVIFQHERTPKNMTGNLILKKTVEFQNLNMTEKPVRSNSKAKEIKNKFDDFRNKHENILNSEKVTSKNKKIYKRREYACNLRKKLFSSLLVKQVIFNAWKNLRKSRVINII